MMDENEQKRIFEEWLAQHKGLVFKVVRAYAFNPQDQEDLFQEVCTQIWNSVPRFQGRSAVTTWMYRVALYSAMDWTRKERRHRDGKQTLDGMEHTLTTTSKFKDSRLGWLYEQIAKLNEVDRSLTLLMLDGFSYREMAEVLGISESNVGVKINRIKKHLTQLSNEEQRHAV